MKKLFVSVLIGMVLLGCAKKNPTTSPPQYKFVIGEAGINIQSSNNISGWDWAHLYSDPAPDRAQSRAYLKYGNIDCPMDLFFFYQNPGDVYFAGAWHIGSPEEACTLKVFSNVGISQGGCLLPGRYTLNAPVNLDTLPWGSVTFSWTQAKYATWYQLRVFCSAYDSVRRQIGGMDTIIYSGACTVSLSDAFFRRVPSALFLVIDFDVTAHGGASPSSNANGNMTGTIKGFFFSTTEDSGSSRTFLMGSPIVFVGPRKPPGITEERRRKDILRAFGL